jgi:hypothetical protein
MPVFIRHAKLLAERGREGADRSMDRIAELGAYVVDNETGEVFDLRGEIFVDQKLLVACALYPSNSSRNE